MLLHITAVTYLDNYRLQVSFNNGVSKQVNLQNELECEIFEPLKNINIFRQVKLNPETKTIEWADGADIAPEFLYETGETENSYEIQNVAA